MRRAWLVAAGVAAGWAAGVAWGAGPRVTAVENGASGTGQVGAGSVVVVKGEWAAEGRCVVAGGDLPERLCGVEVRVGVASAGLLYVDRERAVGVLPLGHGRMRVSVRAAGEESEGREVEVLPAAVAAFRGESGLVRAVGTDGAEISLERPARPGERIRVYATGGGVPEDGELRGLGAGGERRRDFPAPWPDEARLLLGEGVTRELGVEGAVVAAGRAGVWAYELTVPANVPVGVWRLSLSLWGVTDETAELPVAGGSAVGGTIRAPDFTMSDGVPRSIETVTGSVTSGRGSLPIKRSPRGHFLVDAHGDATVRLAGDGWEPYEQATATGVALDLPLIPHLIYPDVKGNYDRQTRTWSLASWYDPLPDTWRGTPGGGDVSLLTMLRALGVNATNPACRESTFTWPTGAVIPVYIDPSRQPFYNEQGNLILGATSGPKSGVDAIKEMLADFTAKTGRQFDLRQEPLEKLTYKRWIPQAGVFHEWYQYDGVYIQFVPISELPAGAAGVAVFPNEAHYERGAKPCGPITGAHIWITNTAGTYVGLGAGFGAHEFSTAVGYGASGRVPFTTDNLGPAARAVWSIRDLDGRRMMEYLGPAVMLDRFGRRE